jgi:hypothetical protein
LARQRQIFDIIGAAVLTCPNVLDMKSGPRKRLLRDSAVLTPLCGTLAHELADRFVHD